MSPRAAARYTAPLTSLADLPFLYWQEADQILHSSFIPVNSRLTDNSLLGELSFAGQTKLADQRPLDLLIAACCFF